LDPQTFYRDMVIAGSPETCAEKIETLRHETGICYLNALSAFFGFLPLPLLRQSLELLAGEVRPKLALEERTPTQEACKFSVLAPDLLEQPRSTR
jgi:hypothetical protein